MNRGYWWTVVGAVVLACSVTMGQEEQPSAGQDRRDDDLSRRLVRQARTGTDEDVMANIIRLMGEAAHKLEIEFDPGEETQTLQTRITEQLDEAILQAAQQQRIRRKEQQVATGDKRRKTTDAQRQESAKAGAQTGETKSQPSDSTEAGTTVSTDSIGGKLDESRRSWGHLPERTRDEIVQGFGEDFLEQYREWIERYYRALQEPGQQAAD